MEPMDDVTFAAEQLVDWGTARSVGVRVAGNGIPMTPVERARLVEDFAAVVPEAEGIVRSITQLSSDQRPSRPWVMSRGQWLQANLRGFERVLEPFAKKVLAARSDDGGAMSKVRRNVLGTQVGGLVGYLGRRVLGQYDVFLPPDDEGLIYFIGTNVAAVERKNGFPQRDFRLWIAVHEVTHRIQFGAAPWLRGHLSSLMDAYLDSVEIDPAWLMKSVKRAIEEVRAGTADTRGFGWIFLLMTPDQREMVRRMQAMMSLLEGHASYVMNHVTRERLPAAAAFRRSLTERRNKGGIEKAFQKAIGFDVKIRQYDMGERFVETVVSQAGTDGFNAVWRDASNLPTLEEISSPESWIARVGA